jgi:hypothetical protein
MEKAKKKNKQPASQKRRRDEKHVLSVSEVLHLKEKERKKKKAVHHRVPLTDFKIVKKGSFKWLGTGDMGSVVGLPRGASMAAIFDALTPTAAIEEMIRGAVASGVKGAQAVTVQGIQQYWAVRAYIHGNRAETLAANFPLSSETFGRKTMSRRRYNKLQHIWITKGTVQILAQASESFVILPEVVTIDEKHKGYEGESPYKRYVPNKDPQWGHWITERFGNH